MFAAVKPVLCWCRRLSQYCWGLSTALEEDKTTSYGPGTSYTAHIRKMSSKQEIKSDGKVKSDFIDSWIKKQNLVGFPSQHFSYMGGVSPECKRVVVGEDLQI